MLAPLWFTDLLPFRLLEGDWWTYFKWFIISACLQLGLLLAPLLQPQQTSFRYDVRFCISIFLHVTLYGPTFPMLRRSRSRFPYKQYSIRVRLRSRRFRATPKSTVPQDPATPDGAITSDPDSPSPRLRPIRASSFEDHMADSFQGIPATQDSLTSLAPDSRDVTRLLKRLDPLTWFKRELTLRENFLTTAKSNRVARRHRALIAAARLLGSKTLSGPTRTQNKVLLSCSHQTSDPPIVLDTGCTISITPLKSDFISPPQPCEDKDSSVKGLTDQARVQGEGIVQWRIKDVFGQVATIRTKAFWIPEADDVRLFSPQAYFDEQKGGHCHFDKAKLTLVLPDGVALDFPYDNSCRLPLMLTDHMPDDDDDVVKGMLSFAYNEKQIESTYQLLHDNNYNLSKPQRELLLWHNRLAHAGFTWLQKLMRKGQPLEIGAPPLPTTIPIKEKGTERCKLPQCPACILGKQHRRTPDTTVIHNKPEMEMAIRRGKLQPGEEVSIDQYYSKVLGRLQHTFGKEKGKDRLTGGTIFVDHASGYISIHNQVSLRVGETLQGKHAFERYARSFGVKIQSYRADNHPFSAAEFVKDLDTLDQNLTFSGVGAHHQNGVAERGLQTVVSWARTMMMHQLIHWPDAFDPALWPFALEQAVFLWNNMPKETGGLSPLEIFSGTKHASHRAVEQARVWGCPVYVLDPKLQDGKKLPKWSKRSRLGVYLGVSPQHSYSVGKVLNLTTGAVSPQYHLVYDELYQTVMGVLTDELFDAHSWNELLQLQGLEQSLDLNDIHDDLAPFQDYFDDFVNADDDHSNDPDASTTTSTSSSSSTSVPEGDEADEGTSESEGANDDGEDDTDAGYRTRSGRRVKPNQKFLHAATYFGTRRTQARTHKHKSHQHDCYMAGGSAHGKVRSRKIDEANLHGLNWSLDFNNLKSESSRRALHALFSSYDPVSETIEQWSPTALAAKANDEDNPSWEQAMNGPNSEGFWEASEKEIRTLEKMRVWDVVDRESWMNVLPSTWAFKIKRYPTGLVRKLKARFCARGDRQIENVDYFETFAPVVSWTTVRLLLMLSVQLGLASKQVDYTAAFVHADIDLPPNYDEMSPDEKRRQGVFVQMPRGFAEPGKVLKLNKSLYGLKQAPRNFFQHLKSKLEAIGFEQAVDVDPCLFISEKVICLTYVDDTLLYAKDMKDIDEVLRRLTDEQEMALEIEDDVAGFLGVQIKRHKDHVSLTQTGLIDRIIEALGVEDLPGVTTPAEDVLGKDEGGDPPNCTFSYASVIGMLWYLHGHSRPDIGFAVSQAARFAFSPRRSHELALIRIGQYLKHTRQKGMQLKPTELDKFTMDVYVDSDFMGLYGKELRTDPTNVKSRTGYVICLNGCPVIWSSKLQESIAMSTMMAEYYALSTAMREVLPLRSLVEAVADACGINNECVSTFKTTVWEDNMGALSLANLDPGQHTPRSKFYDVKVHWFRSHLKPNQIEVKKIDTSVQLADLFTKPLSREVFERLRGLLLGW